MIVELGHVDVWREEAAAAGEIATAVRARALRLPPSSALRVSMLGAADDLLLLARLRGEHIAPVTEVAR